MSAEKQLVGNTIANELNKLRFGESVTLNLGDLIRKTLADIKSEKQNMDEYSPYNTVNS